MLPCKQEWLRQQNQWQSACDLTAAVCADCVMGSWEIQEPSWELCASLQCLLVPYMDASLLQSRPEKWPVTARVCLVKFVEGTRYTAEPKRTSS